MFALSTEALAKGDIGHSWSAFQPFSLSAFGQRGWVLLLALVSVRWPSMSTPAPVQENAIITTSYGDLTLAFWPDIAPKTVENFKKLARSGFYDGTAFHRIIKGFMIQGGCPNTKAGAHGMPGTGDAGYKLKAEFNDKPHVRGVISMARSSHPDSAGCQFFIVHGDARFLDKQYTAFGQLVAGDDVLERIATVPVGGSGGEKSQPIERIEVKSVRIVQAS
jgi:peptidyl-prolyl cis-trans isomerase B (cyclophilin B)